MMRNLLHLLLLALLLAGCSSGGYSNPPPLDGAELARQGTAAAQQSQAYQKAILDATRTAEARLEATQQAQAGTAAAMQATADAVTATAESAIAEATRNGLILAATSDAAIANATAAAVAALADLDRQMIVAEATRQALELRQQEAAAERAETWAEFVKFGRWVLLGLALLAGLVLWKAYKLRRSPVVVVANDQEHVFYDSHYYRPLSIGRSQPAGLLEAGTAVNPREPVELTPDIVQRGHIMIAGATDSGKTTVARFIHLARGGKAVVIDPHDDGMTWGDVPVFGGGRDWESIDKALATMLAMFEGRYQQRSAGRQDFEPVTFYIDEMPAIADAKTPDGQKIIQTDVWYVCRKLLREGRKVRISLVAMTQSTRVKSLGISGEGDLLQNFAALFTLGIQAVIEYGDLVEGMERPAAMRTVHGIRPVIIPYTPPLGPRRLNGMNPMPRTNGLPIEVISNRPPLQAPGPEQDDLNELRRREDQQIRELLEQGLTMAEIERQVFGYNGGLAYDRVKAIKMEMEQQ